VVNGWAVRKEIEHWQDAASLRDRVMLALRADPAFSLCPALTLNGLPDNVRGAYVFRVGAPEAVRRATGKEIVAQAGRECRLTWNPATDRFIADGVPVAAVQAR
jgi:hypothetical protein